MIFFTNLIFEYIIHMFQKIREEEGRKEHSQKPHSYQVPHPTDCKPSPKMIIFFLKFLVYPEFFDQTYGNIIIYYFSTTFT